MNTNSRTRLKGMKPTSKQEKVMEKEKEKEKLKLKAAEMKTNKPAANAGKVTATRRQSRRETKIALQQDVDKLRKKLRHEENVHRALERAFTRPLGALPRLPPYLPSHTLELLAEVAVLEEEVVRLEEQVVDFRQRLYQEAISISSSKKTKENSQDFSHDQLASANTKDTPPHIKPSISVSNSDAIASTRPNSHRDSSSTSRVVGEKQTPRRQNPSLSSNDDRPGKENQLTGTNTSRNVRQSPVKKVSKTRTMVTSEKRMDAQPVRAENDSRRTDNQPSSNNSSGPNKLSEELLQCLVSIFLQMSSADCQDKEPATSPSVSGSSIGSDDADLQDPYGILEFGRRDIGSYKQFRVVDAHSFRPNILASSSLLVGRLKTLLGKLASVDLVGLSHQQKLAFWINIYNSCMMNAFLEQGILTSPQMLVALMPKAVINVAGHMLSAMTIEHFVLRLPYNIKHVYPKGMKGGDLTMPGIFGLEWPEPLVTFALSCGSWSSPAVRVYTACNVEEELETAKKDYLQAAIGISTPNKLAVPKLLHWYLLDFAKDVDSFMDWICMQLPAEQQQDAVKLLETGRSASPGPIQVLPFDFRFRYLLAS